MLVLPFSVMFHRFYYYDVSFEQFRKIHLPDIFLVCFAEERLVIILNEVRGETKLRQKQREELLRKIKQLQSRAHQRREQGETNSCLRSLPKFAGRAESAAGKNTSSMSPMLPLHLSYPSFTFFYCNIYFCFLFNSFFLLFLYCF